MFKIITKQLLNPTVCALEIYAPLIANKCQPGQFVIVRTNKNGERIPLTIAKANRQSGGITIVFQIMGATTYDLSQKQVGDYVSDFVGPLGRATSLDGLNKVAVIGGGVGCAIAYPIAKKLYEQGSIVHSIIGFRSSDLVIFESEFSNTSNQLDLMTDDGSAGRKGLVTDALEEKINCGHIYDQIIAIGPTIMMKFVVEVAKKHNIPVVVSMNPIMVDGTGMCGGCRLLVDGQMRFACVDGPDFDGTKVDFDEMMRRSNLYRQSERLAFELAKQGER